MEGREIGVLGKGFSVVRPVVWRRGRRGFKNLVPFDLKWERGGEDRWEVIGREEEKKEGKEEEERGGGERREKKFSRKEGKEKRG